MHAIDLLKALAPLLPAKACDGLTFSADVAAAVQKRSVRAATSAVRKRWPDLVATAQPVIADFFAQCDSSQRDLVATIADRNFRARGE